MASSHPPTVTPHDLLRTLREHPRRWVVPAVVVTALAVVFAIVRPRSWEAVQALTIRDEVSIDTRQQANSTRADDVKATQETILELAHSQAVLRKTLEVVGPAKAQTAKGFPTALDIEEFGEDINLTPPKGSEFGKTDIFYLKAQARARDRALKLAEVLSLQVQGSYEELRRMKAHSVILELQKTVELARKDLDDCTKRLTAMEQAVGGSDLGELRIMNEMPSGMSDLRNESFAIENELRTVVNAQVQNEQLLEILRAAQVDRGALIACPNSLLTMQPGLKRLKDGLVDAQIKLATLLGSLSSDHPQVIAAQESTVQIGKNLHNELAIAIRGIQSEMKLNQDRIASLESQKARLHGRFDKLADVRATYGNLAALAMHRGEILKAAELELAEARSKQAAAHAGPVLQLIGDPVTGTRPIGPGRTAIVLGGLLGGLILGIGIVVLTAQPAALADAAETKPQPPAQPQAPAAPAFIPSLSEAATPPVIEINELLPPIQSEYLAVGPGFPPEPLGAEPAKQPSLGAPPLTLQQALQRIAASKGGS
jgi:uncharacterized protein involved in exopolysaccharide biosynthesis